MNTLAHLPTRAAPQVFHEPTKHQRAGTVTPAAVVIVPVPRGRAEGLRALLFSLARSRGAGDVPMAAGALAVLVVSDHPDVRQIVESMAPELPFPLRIEPGPGDLPLALRLASDWAAALDAPGVPVLIAAPGAPVAPRWAHTLLSALRDGADLVTHRAGWTARLAGTPAEPLALSGRAQWVLERWAAEDGPGPSPLQRPERAGLRVVSV